MADEKKKNEKQKSSKNDNEKKSSTNDSEKKSSTNDSEKKSSTNDSEKKSSIAEVPKSGITIATTSTSFGEQPSISSEQPSISNEQLPTGRTDELCPQALSRKGFSIGKQIAKGQFGVIYEASCTSMPNRKLVCKYCSLTGKENSEWVEKCLKIEMKVLMQLRHHQNIVKCEGVYKTRRAAFIFMDFVEKGNILEYMHRQKKPLSERQTKIWLRDITSALCYTHERKIAHRDLKLENFMIDRDDRAILTDFGFACQPADLNYIMLKGTKAGTADYMAPEIRGLGLGKCYDPLISDMYSMGVCLYEMLHYALPFGSGTDTDPQFASTTLHKQKNRIYKLDNNISNSAKDLINKMLDPEPKTRITALNALHHDFLKV